MPIGAAGEVRIEVSDSAGLRYWTPSLLLRCLLIWTAFTTVIFWLPTVRSVFDGSSYTWGIAGFGGSGLQGDLWFPLAGAILSLVLLTLGWRGARSPFHFVLVGWHVLLLVGVIRAVRSDPEGFRFRGDSLGVDISLAWIGPVVFGIPAVLAALWAWQDLRGGDHAIAPPWTRTNTRWVVALLLLLPVQFVLLRTGPPGSAADAVGVMITIIQWLLVGAALQPASLRPAAQGSA
jgi:hypothetical protein